MIIIHIITIPIYVLVILLVQHFFSKKLKEKIKQFMVYDLYDLYKNMFVVLSFFLFFVFLLRVVRIIVNDHRKFDLNKLKIFIPLEFKYYFIWILTLLLLIVISYFIKNYIFGFFRLNFFRIYYKYFYKEKKVMSIFNLILNMENSFLNLFSKTKIKYAKFLFNHGMKTILLLIIFKGIIFDHGIINMQFLPYYGLYYTVYSTHKLALKMKNTFDFGFFLFFDDAFLINSSGRFKLDCYIGYLVLGYSEYHFYDDFDINRANNLGRIHSKVLYFNFNDDTKL